MRAAFGVGKPRALQDAGKALRAALRAVLSRWCALTTALTVFLASRIAHPHHRTPARAARLAA